MLTKSSGCLPCLGGFGWIGNGPDSRNNVGPPSGPSPLLGSKPGPRALRHSSLELALTALPAPRQLPRRKTPPSPSPVPLPRIQYSPLCGEPHHENPLTSWLGRDDFHASRFPGWLLLRSSSRYDVAGGDWAMISSRVCLEGARHRRLLPFQISWPRSIFCMYEIRHGQSASYPPWGPFNQVSCSYFSLPSSRVLFSCPVHLEGHFRDRTNPPSQPHPDQSGVLDLTAQVLVRTSAGGPSDLSGLTNPDVSRRSRS